MASIAHVDEWEDQCASVSEIEQALIDLRARRGWIGTRNLRSSVLTHMAWVPPEWQEAATETLAGLAERHPSRTLLLFPQPDAEDGLAARVLLECYDVPDTKRHLCSDVVQLDLRGARATAPASIVLPLLLPHLPVFLRWRGLPPFRSPVLDQLVAVADRLVLDSAEWPDPAAGYAELPTLFEQAAVTDIAWRRTVAWRRELARAWPDLPDRLIGPPAETTLLAGWLRSRAGVDVEIEPAPELPIGGDGSASDLLSNELDVFVRDPIYEAAVRAVTPGPHRAGRP
ncbi:MAG: glucose-6-phosphate dehydrogenase assembly protein OpcA [Actinomycetota bacterium]|nr:glucose-6-phosphate dehydrogenase assembly protein OpcA [Actinomycetota bacterium]